MGNEIPPEEIGTCKRCNEEFRRQAVGHPFCCTACGEGKSEHSPDCRRKGTEGFLREPSRPYTLESEPGEILWHMQSRWQSTHQGNPNLITIGAAALTYKGAQLNYKAAEKIARYTKALVWLTAALVFEGIVRPIIAFN